MNFIRLFGCWLVLSAQLIQADFGDRAINWSSKESADFQDYAIRSLNSQNKILNDYWLHYWLNEIYLELNVSSPRPIPNTQIAIINDPRINAFAMPGNVIGINTGLWLASDHEDELISVLAHEMAHIALDHFSRLSETSNRQSLTLATGILVSILLAQQNPDAANAALFGSLAASQQTQLNYSRAMETEADQLAQAIMENANYDPEAGRSFFQKLDNNSSAQQATEFLRTHPLGNTRSSQLSGKTAPTENKPPSEVFKLLTQRLDRTNDPVESDTDTPEQNNPHVLLARGILENRENDNWLNELLLRFPDFHPAALHLLSGQIKSKTVNCDVFSSLNRKLKDDPVTLDALDTMANAANQCSHQSYPLWFSQWLWQSGKEPEALYFLREELNGEPTTNQAAVLKTRLELLTDRYERFN